MRTFVSAFALAVVILATPLAYAQTCEELVTLETYDGAISMYHHEAQYNCCAYIEVQVSQEPSVVEFVEREMFDDGPCYCLCCFDVASVVSGLEPGEYLVRVWKGYNNFDGTWTFELVHEETVIVDGHSMPGVQSSYIPCVETAIDEEPAETSWGVIKGLYR